MPFPMVQQKGQGENRTTGNRYQVTTNSKKHLYGLFTLCSLFPALPYCLLPDTCYFSLLSVHCSLLIALFPCYLFIAFFPYSLLLVPCYLFPLTYSLVSCNCIPCQYRPSPRRFWLKPISFSLIPRNRSLKACSLFSSHQS